MLANIVVGLIFAAIILSAFKKVRNDAKNKSCSCGSSSSCSSKSNCNKQ